MSKPFIAWGVGGEHIDRKVVLPLPREFVLTKGTATLPFDPTWPLLCRTPIKPFRRGTGSQPLGDRPGGAYGSGEPPRGP